MPAFLFGSPAGVFVDRVNRRTLMVWVNVAMAVSLLPLLAWIRSGSGSFTPSLVVATLLKQLFLPAEVALLPQLVGKEDLVAANSLSTLNRQLARLIGPVIGGATVALGRLDPGRRCRCGELHHRGRDSSRSYRRALGSRGCG